MTRDKKEQALAALDRLEEIAGYSYHDSEDYEEIDKQADTIRAALESIKPKT